MEHLILTSDILSQVYIQVSCRHTYCFASICACVVLIALMHHSREKSDAKVCKLWLALLVSHSRHVGIFGNYSFLFHWQGSYLYQPTLSWQPQKRNHLAYPMR